MLSAPALRRCEGRLETVVKDADKDVARPGTRGDVAAPAERTGAMRAGWNDAAWGRPRRQLADDVSRWYELGYAGGLIFRRKRQTRREGDAG